jgi:hypothetical protein
MKQLLASYGPSYEEMHRRAADYAASTKTRTMTESAACLEVGGAPSLHFLAERRILGQFLWYIAVVHRQPAGSSGNLILLGFCTFGICLVGNPSLSAKNRVKRRRFKFYR